MSNKTVFVLDAAQRSALATVRSLGAHKELSVIAGDEYLLALAGTSKFCDRYVQYPSPQTDPLKFLSWVSDFIQHNNIDFLQPVTEVSSQLLIMHGKDLPPCILPFAPLETIHSLANKWLLTNLASKLNIPHPETQYFANADALDVNSVTEYPVVIKPCMSKIWLEDRWLASTVHVAHSKAELKNLLGNEYFQHPFMLQDFIPGTGAGIFALYASGRPVVYFAHRRLREKPPGGGVSVLSESRLPDRQLKEYSEKLLKAVDWHGVAMVEYRVTPAGKAYLMEVNTRFWGSLQLSIDSGVNFPWLLYQIATGETVRANQQYAVGQRLRWLLGDLDRLYLVLKDSRSYSSSEKIRALQEFLTPSWRNSRQEIFRFDDMRPAMHELKEYVRQLIS